MQVNSSTYTSASGKNDHFVVDNIVALARHSAPARPTKDEVYTVTRSIAARRTGPCVRARAIDRLPACLPA